MEDTINKNISWKDRLFPPVFVHEKTKDGDKYSLNKVFIGRLIILNAIVLICLCFENFPRYQIYFQWIDIILTFLFVGEISFRWIIEKSKFFIEKDNCTNKKFIKGWNIFDFVIVLLSFIGIIGELFVNSFANMEAFILFRCLRLLKFFRILDIHPELEKIVSDFKKTIRLTFWLILIGFILVSTIGVLLCLFCKNLDPENFGNPFISIYSVFRLFSVEGWYEIPDAMSERTPYVIIRLLIKFGFSFLVFFGMIIFGFIISSITDKLAEDNTKELEEKVEKLDKKIDLLISKITNG